MHFIARAYGITPRKTTTQSGILSQKRKQHSFHIPIGLNSLRNSTPFWLITWSGKTLSNNQANPRIKTYGNTTQNTNHTRGRSATIDSEILEIPLG